MAAVAVIILFALVFAVTGLLIEGLRWALVIGLILLLLGAVGGFRARSRTGPGPSRTNPTP